MKEKPENELINGIAELKSYPSFIQDRLNLWDKFKQRHDEEIASKFKENIIITLSDGRKVNGQSWQSTPYEIMKRISRGLSESSIVAKVNEELWDLNRPLEQSCTLQLLKFDDDEGINKMKSKIDENCMLHLNLAKEIFWHSSAHILGQAMECIYGGMLCHGPPLESGFFYDMHMEGKQVSSQDFEELERVFNRIVTEAQAFERLELPIEDLLELFSYNPFKLHILHDKVKTQTTTVYRCGSLIDLCRGPHIRHTGLVRAFRITKNSAAYWEGVSTGESLQRVYGISFPDSKQLKVWQQRQEEAAQRDHRRIGRDQELFMFHEYSPGSCFFLPKGAHIYRCLEKYIQEEYFKRGFQEVVTPNIFSCRLWQTSGHWDFYKDSIFSFEVEKEQFALKPMNCPGHCLMFGFRPRSWRELPLRLADFGVLHRNELSGALSGLTRVRRFQQDDAHIFCAPEDVKKEIHSALEFLHDVYGTFCFSYSLVLATRPEKFMGDIELWNLAEQALTEALQNFNQPWKLNPGDGAFYGPKIDISVRDALGRSHQCATIQLDFQLPQRFDLNFTNESGEKKKPVIIHRAILGSLERMIAILTECYAGKWPFWLSPRQVMVIPVAPAHNEYAKFVYEKLKQAGYQCDVDDDDSDTMKKKIRNAQLSQYNFILVVGDREKEAQSINVRTRANRVVGERSFDTLLHHFEQLTQSRSWNSEEPF